MVRFASALKEEKTGYDKFINSVKNFIVFNVKGYNPKKCVVAIFKNGCPKQEVKYQRNNLKILAKKYNPVFAELDKEKWVQSHPAIAYKRLLYGSKYYWRNS